MRVLLPTMLRSYSLGAPEVEATGTTVGELLADLDAKYPGIRFRVIDEQDRIRTHMRIFLNGDLAPDLSTPIPPNSTVQLVGALSGG